MLERAIIEQKVDDYHYRVRIPPFNKSTAAVGATPERELYVATLSVTPGVSPKFKPGTAVCVSFESNDLSAPVIVGLLFNSTFKKTEADATFASLDVSVNTTLSRDTTVGNVKPDNIASLENNTQNVADKFQKIDLFEQNTSNKLNILSSDLATLDARVTQAQLDILKKMEESDEELAGRLSDVESLADTNSADIIETNSSLNNHTGNTTIHVTSSDKTNWNSKAAGSHNHTSLSGVQKIVFTTASYGTELPATGTTGQIFFKLESE